MVASVGEEVWMGGSVGKAGSNLPEVTGLNNAYPPSPRYTGGGWFGRAHNIRDPKTYAARAGADLEAERISVLLF